MKTHSVVSLLVFTCFLVIGYSYSTRFYQSGVLGFTRSAKGVTSDGLQTIATLENGQRSILLIGASQFDTNAPRLESVWLATYIPKEPNIRLFPIFPTGKQPISDLEAQLGSFFSFHREGRNLELSQDFTGLLEKNNYWWSGYLVFDNYSMSKIIDLPGGIAVNAGSMVGPDVVKLFQNGVNDVNTNYSAQVAIIQSLCQRFTHAEPSLIISQVVKMVPNHILSDLDTSQLQQELDSLWTDGHPATCRFPTLEISRIEP